MRSWPAALVVTLIAAVVCAEDAQQTFDSIYGERIKEVTATREREDDVALAGDLLTVARSSANQPELLAVICNASYDLGRRHPSGYRTAVDAMALLAGHGSKQQRDAARENMIDLLTRLTRVGEDDEKAKAMDELIALFETIAAEQSAAGDDDDAVRTYRRALILATRDKHPKAEAIKSQMEAALARHRITLRIKRLREQLLTNADPSAARELALIYTLDLDDAEKAVPYLRHAKDEELKAMVTLAATDPAKLDAEQSLKLGEWYHEKAKAARSGQRVALLRRAERMLSRYANLSPNELKSAATRLTLADVTREIERLEQTETDTRPRPADKPVARLIVDAIIDGNSDLIVTPDGLHWKHHGWAKPTDVTINEKPWPLEWSDPNPRVQDTSKTLPVRWPKGNVTATTLDDKPDRNRGKVIIESTGDNLMIRVQDSQGGAGRYRFLISVQR